jgi:hypothetical protein
VLGVGGEGVPAGLQANPPTFVGGSRKEPRLVKDAARGVGAEASHPASKAAAAVSVLAWSLSG